MNDLTLLHESVVEESQIDSLGHMNVRYYLTRAAAANLELLGRVGMKADNDQSIRRVDTYNRFHKEQFAGNKLAVYGGFVQIEGSTGVSGYYEIRNTETNDLAAAFIMTSNLFNKASQTMVNMNGLDQDTIRSSSIQIPEYSLPRTLNLAPPRVVTYDEINELIPDAAEPGNMNGQRRGVVLEEDCDEQGQLKEDVDPMFIMFRPQPGEELKNMGPPITRDEEGRRYSFAMMEIRTINYLRPTLGDEIVSMSADINFGEKWRHTRRWIFNSKTGGLLGISDHAAVCMDLDARRAIPIPAALRDEMKQKCLRDFA